jgi:aryl-alcohol dehydrogenase-like predicted oxidoreductase
MQANNSGSKDVHVTARLDIAQQRLGLGCARLGSILGRDRAEAAHLVHAAFEKGIRFFDTANIYGQGESERILGSALRGRRQRVTIVTKAGQYFPPWTRLARPLKRVLAPLIRQSGSGRLVVSKIREAALPQDFSDRFLRSSTEASLRRLNTDYVDILLLHSPPSHLIANGDAMRSLEKIRASGKATKIGVSCEDVASGLFALDDRRVEVVELPLWPVTDATNRFLERAGRQSAFVIGRGLMSTALQAGSNERWTIVRAALTSSLARREISRLLIGTTRIANLTEVLETIQNIEVNPCT